MLAVGVLSGTSADGIDVAIVRNPLTKPRIIDATTYAYKSATRKAVLKGGELSAKEVAQLNRDVAEEFATAINSLLRRSKQKISIIGSHGQTIFHSPGISSLQVGSPAVIASRTGIPIAADFRSDDIAAGGQGAPLVPILDRMLARDAVFLNMGGIANISVIRRGRVVTAYDTGPANAMIDSAMRLFFGRSHDADGRIARSGKSHPTIVRNILGHGYFKKRPPKTTGPEEFGDDFVRRLAKKFKGAPEDFIASVTEAAGHSIAREIRRHEPRVVFASGGGMKNPALMNFLSALPMKNSREAGADPDFKEAMLFAVLGAMRFNEIPIDLKTITGADRPKILGGLWRPE